jgi:hypothetical protein
LPQLMLRDIDFEIGKPELQGCFACKTFIVHGLSPDRGKEAAVAGGLLAVSARLRRGSFSAGCRCQIWDTRLYLVQVAFLVGAPCRPT